MPLTFELASFRVAPDDEAALPDEIPEARTWFRHIAESHGLRHVEVVHEEPLQPRA
jgi:hypothetical protein